MDAPPPSQYTYTFDQLARTINGFVEKIGASRYILYVQDFGGPVGFRIALAHSDRVTGIVVQNANAYISEAFKRDLPDAKLDL